MKQPSTAILAVLSLGSALMAAPVPADENGEDKAIESVVEGTAHHETVLEGTMETAPEEAQSGLEKAMENSSKGQSNALEGLERRTLDMEKERNQWNRERSGQSFDRPTRGPRRR